MMARIASATANRDFTVDIAWSDGTRSVVSFRATIDKGSVFSPLRDPDFFATRMTIGGDGDWLGWPDELDFSADSLWYRAHPEAEIDEIAATGS